MTLMSVIVAFLFAISLWYLSSNHKVTFVKLKATDLKFLPDRSWHRLIPAGGTFVSAKGGTFQSDTPGTFVSAMRGTIDSAVPGTFESDTGGTFNPLLSLKVPKPVLPGVLKSCGKKQGRLFLVVVERLGDAFLERFLRVTVRRSGGPAEGGEDGAADAVESAGQRLAVYRPIHQKENGGDN